MQASVKSGNAAQRAPAANDVSRNRELAEQMSALEDHLIARHWKLTGQAEEALDKNGIHGFSKKDASSAAPQSHAPSGSSVASGFAAVSYNKGPKDDPKPRAQANKRKGRAQPTVRSSKRIALKKETKAFKSIYIPDSESDEAAAVH